VLPDPLSEAREAAHSAYVDAVTLGVSPEQRVDALVDAVIASLSANGALPDPELLPTEQHLTETAQLLAVASGMPEYAGDSWTYLRVYASDVRRAYLEAVARLSPDQEKLAATLAMAQRRLLEHVSESTS
jgi:hypothetical protein